ncbi:MAG: porin [Pseudomonadota bacterium]
MRVGPKLLIAALAVGLALPTGAWSQSSGTANTEQVAKPAKKKKGKPKTAAGLNLKYSLFGHAYFGYTDFSGPNANAVAGGGPSRGLAKSGVSDEFFTYATGLINPSYVWVKDGHKLEIGAHANIFLIEDWIDDDLFDEHSIYVKSNKYGTLYFGEDDGAWDKLKPQRAGRVAISVGQGAYTGCINWWCNYPFGGGANRGGIHSDVIDFRNGIPGLDVRAGIRDTGDALKIGYLTPKIPVGPGNLTLGASINLQETAAGDEGTRGASSRQDEYNDLGLQDEFEIAGRWIGKVNDYEISTSLGFVQSQVTNDGPSGAGINSTSQQGIAAGARVGTDIEGFGKFRVSLQYDWQKYDQTRPGVPDVDHHFHLGMDLKRGKWTFGANAIHAIDSVNARGQRLLGGDNSTAFSLGADYKLTKWMTIGAGTAYAFNEADEEAWEIGGSVTIRYGDVLNLGKIE